MRLKLFRESYSFCGVIQIRFLPPLFFLFFFFSVSDWPFKTRVVIIHKPFSGERVRNFVGHKVTFTVRSIITRMSARTVTFPLPYYFAPLLYNCRCLLIKTNPKYLNSLKTVIYSTSRKTQKILFSPILMFTLNSVIFFSSVGKIVSEDRNKISTHFYW